MYCCISDHEVVLTKLPIQAKTCPLLEDLFICGVKLTLIFLFNHFMKTLSPPSLLLLPLVFNGIFLCL